MGGEIEREKGEGGIGEAEEEGRGKEGREREGEGRGEEEREELANMAVCMGPSLQVVNRTGWDQEVVELMGL